MSSNITTFSEKWDHWFTELADPRTNEWFLISSPLPLLAILIIYLYFVLYTGPKFMKDRKPYSFKNTLVIYNFIQVLISAYLVIEGIAIWRNFNLKCQPIDYSNNPLALRVARFCHIYYLAKITELLDTIFFVLRKKDNQVTFLHLYHHSGMPAVTWFIAKYVPGGHITLYGVINSFVHVVMYTYYMLAAFGPKIHKYLWWKKHITTLQLIQFAICGCHASQLLVYECGYPKLASAFALPNAVLFLFLFGDFYRKAYVLKAKSKHESSSCDSSEDENHNIKQNGNCNNNETGIIKTRYPSMFDDILEDKKAV